MRESYIIPTSFENIIYDYKCKEGIHNDLDGGMDFWPQGVTKYGEIYASYTMKELKEKYEKSSSEQIKNTRARKHLKEMLNQLPENTNFVIAVLKVNL